MDYGYNDRRRTKKDLKLKRKRRAYKRGGKFRGTNIQIEELEDAVKG
jgi:hypothetical protein